MTSKTPDGEPKALHPDRARRLADEAEAMPARDPRRIAAAVALFERLTEHWSLRGDEREALLGGIPKSTWSEWRQRPTAARIKSDTRERIANLFAIDLNAHSLFAPEFADRWIRQSNVAFGGGSPLSAMLRGRVEDIISVRRYLERIRSASPSGGVRSEGAGSDEKLTLSFLPGGAVESDAEDATLSALRQATAIFERLALREAARYRPALAVTLGALATCLEETDDAEAVTVLQRAVEIQTQVASELPAPEDTSDDLNRPANRSEQIVVSNRAANVIISVAMLDPTFNPALLAQLDAIALQPLAYPALPTRNDVRIAYMSHRGVTWRVVFIISEPHLLTVIWIEPTRSASSGPDSNPTLQPEGPRVPEAGT